MNPGRFTWLAAALAAVASLSACAAGSGSYSIAVSPAPDAGAIAQVLLPKPDPTHVSHAGDLVPSVYGNGANTGLIGLTGRVELSATSASPDESGLTFVFGITDSLLAGRPAADEAFQVPGASAPDTVIRGIESAPLPL